MEKLFDISQDLQNFIDSNYEKNGFVDVVEVANHLGIEVYGDDLKDKTSYIRYNFIKKNFKHIFMFEKNYLIKILILFFEFYRKGNEKRKYYWYSVITGEVVRDIIAFLELDYEQVMRCNKINYCRQPSEDLLEYYAN